MTSERNHSALAFALFAGVLAWGAASHSAAAPSRAADLAGRLIAPCCFVQTLDVHESELASALRSEIRTRLARGETPQQIEADLVQRYGERILAVPRGSDPRRTIPLITGAALAIAAVALVLVGLRWRKRSDRPQSAIAQPESALQPADIAAYDRALDEALRRSDP